MAIGPENVVVVYRRDDGESREFAERYRDFYSLDNNQLVDVPCSQIEIVANYGKFQDEVETPLKSALNTGPLDDRTVFAVVLMPRVTGGFYDGGDIISATSRISRMYHPFLKKEKNPLYNRQTFKRFDGNDADIGLICTRFDSPTAAITTEWFDAAEEAARQVFVKGKFFFDPYSAYHRAGAEDYELELLFFFNGLLQRLGLDIETTVRVDPYDDPLISSLENDSFYWGWGADRASLSFFKSSIHLRTFFYNADFDGAEVMRSIDARSFPVLAIRSGYAATAGHMSNPGIDGFLRPCPFFDGLFRGATLGETLLFSVPHLNWTTAFFGDPLMQILFPEDFDDTGLVNVDVAWGNMANNLAQSIVNIFRKSNIIKNLRDEILKGKDLNVSLALVNPMEEVFKNYNLVSWRNDYVNVVKSLINFATARNITNFDRHFPKLNEYLARTDNKVTEILLETLQNKELIDTIDEEFIETEGSWDLEFVLEHEQGTFAFYHFELEVSDKEDFSNILLNKKSREDISGWFFENSEDDFETLTNNGLPSSFAGRNVKYVNQGGESLTRGVFYYFRIRQSDQLRTFDFRTFKRVIYR